MRIVWFEGPVGRAHAILKKEAKNGKKIVAINSSSDFDENITFRDVFNDAKCVIVLSEDVQDLDAKISNIAKSWTEDDMAVFINAKRTSWNKCCSIAKEKKTLVEIPFKVTKAKAMSFVKERLKLSDDNAWVAQMVADSCGSSAWSKDVDAEKLDMSLIFLETLFMRRTPRDKTDLGCAMGFHASEILAKVSEAKISADVHTFCKMHETITKDMHGSIHAIQAVSSSNAVKNSKLHLLKSINAKNEKIMAFKKSDGNSLFNQFVVNKTDSNAKMSFSFADYISTCESAAIVPYGAWGSLAWSATLLHKSGSISSSQLAKIISAYKSIRKERKNATDA